MHENQDWLADHSSRMSLTPAAIDGDKNDSGTVALAIPAEQRVAAWSVAEVDG
jgi:hypothetical protein